MSGIGGRPTTPVVDAMEAIPLEGNIVPHGWYAHVVFPSGDVDLKAIVILAEICYWYKPSVVKDEYTGMVLRRERKFSADMLQRSYQAFANQFGLSKREATDAVDRLVSAGLVVRQFRTIVTNLGTLSNNVMFVAPVPEAVRQITLTQDGTPIAAERGTLSHSNVIGLTSKRDTNTENIGRVAENTPTLPTVAAESAPARVSERTALIQLPRFVMMGKKAKNTKGLSLAPDSVRVTESGLQWAQGRGYTGDLAGLQEYAEACVRFRKKKGERFADWEAELEDWLLRDIKRGPSHGSEHGDIRTGPAGVTVTRPAYGYNEAGQPTNRATALAGAAARLEERQRARRMAGQDGADVVTLSDDEWRELR